MKLESKMLARCVALAVAGVGTCGIAEGKLTRITVTSESVVDHPSFGATGAYRKIAGTFEGVLDRADRRNALIADIDLVQGPVTYKSTFFIMRPVDLAKGNSKLFFDFGNRGNKRIFQWFNDGVASDNPTTAQDFGNGFLMRQGYSVALSGWMGDAPTTPNSMGVLSLPIARNADGTAITGPVEAEMVAGSAAATTINLPYEAAEMTPANGVLYVRERATDPKVAVTGWTYSNARRITFPGPAKPQWIYQFVYTAKNPTVMGIGHAMSRDFLSFVRNEAVDDFGNANPLGGGIRKIYSWGRSNGGRVEKDFLRWGFNEDENGRIVIDGMMPYANGSGGLVWINTRFSQPTASSRKHERHFAYEPEFPHTLPVIHDPISGQTDGILRRCLVTGTCPKFFHIDGGNEYWNKSSSLNTTDSFGRDLDIERMAPNVRMYYIASIDHNTEFDEGPQNVAECVQLTNPLYNGPVFRALAVALDAWVTKGARPPASEVPRASKRTLVPPEQVRFPAIPATHYAGWPALEAANYTPETMNRNVLLDFSVVPPAPVPGKEYTVLVPQVDEDGNDIDGIRLPFLEVPLGTHTGWSQLHAGAGFPDSCGQHGTFLPFPNTKAERLAAGDPRKSIAERYKDQKHYVKEVAKAAKKLVKDGFLLEEDEERIVSRAEAEGMRLWVPTP